MYSKELTLTLRSETIESERLDLKIQAIPPPLPEVRGEWRREKLGGVKELRIQEGESGDNQVSVRNNTSRDWSSMNSLITAGLSRLSVIAVADLTFKHEKRVGNEEEMGPGLISTLPDRNSNKETNREM